MGALGVALVLGPAFAMGSPFDFPREVDVSLTPLADDTEASRDSARSMVFDSETDLVDLRRLVTAGAADPDRAWLRERLRVVRARVDCGGVASVEEGGR